jgi:hypothetical protein
VLAGLEAGRPFPEAFRAATGSTLPGFEDALRDHLGAVTAAR